MKNKILTRLVQGISNIRPLEGVKFAYALAKNKRLIVSELEIFDDLTKMSEEYAGYEKKRIELCEKYCQKDENGKAIMVKNEYTIKDRKKFDIEQGKLSKNNKKPIEDRKKQIKEFNEFLEKESSFTPFEIKMEDIPVNINSGEFDNIFELIEEDKSKK